MLHNAQFAAKQSLFNFFGQMIITQCLLGVLVSVLFIIPLKAATIIHLPKTTHPSTTAIKYAIVGLFCKDSIYGLTAVDVQPKFVGGEAALFKYLAQNIKYPVLTNKDTDLLSTPKISFVVNKRGLVEDVSVLSAYPQSWNDETAKIVANMPKWIPAYHKKKRVKVRYVLPIRIRW
ncbi:MAG: energy transducer TonB [Chitinophagales bacterium]|jgi:hypothetical protein|nr:energy transducer TonB [Chitinophagales bacterium]